jgi:hypothetical protein
MATNRIAGGSANQLVGYAAGAAFLVVGLLGFIVSGDHAFAGEHGGNLLGFQVNGLHNIVHLAVGAALLAGAVSGMRASKTVNTLVGAVYLLVGVLGLFVIENGSLNLIALNWADNGLHFASAALLLAVGLSLDRARTPARV